MPQLETVAATQLTAICVVFCSERRLARAVHLGNQPQSTRGVGFETIKTFFPKAPLMLKQSNTRERVTELTHEIKNHSEPFRRIVGQVNQVLVGQEKLVHRMLVGLLANGHLLIEGVPGLAKTTAVASLSKAINTGFQRLQFTPDLLPADLIGTQVYRPQDQSFVVQKGPIFSNLILADEINRAPAKVQSALLEAMQERQVTIGGETFPLDNPFLVMATQNPVDQEGTYQLPEAQTDRFMLKVIVEYPNRDEELKILQRMSKTSAIFEIEASDLTSRDFGGSRIG